MHNSFISIVHVIHQRSDITQLGDYLMDCYQLLKDNFNDFEIILVNNIPEWQLKEIIEPLPSEVKPKVYLIQLSNRTNRNHAILAGLDRANGDYTVIFESIFAEQPKIILSLFDKSQEQYDLVYLQAKNRLSSWPSSWLYRLFYYILRRYSHLKIDKNAHNTRIISRRALNSLLKLRENLRYMKAIYSIVGYRTAFITTDVPLPEEDGIRERFRTSLIAITSYTTFLRSSMLWLFLGSLFFLIGVVSNTLKVKFTQTDLLGHPAVADSGWTFLVVLIAVFFAVTTLNLYIMSIYLSNIYTEIKRRPPYIIESVQRF